MSLNLFNLNLSNEFLETLMEKHFSRYYITIFFLKIIKTLNIFCRTWSLKSQYRIVSHFQPNRPKYFKNSYCAETLL